MKGKRSPRRGARRCSHSAEHAKTNQDCPTLPAAPWLGKSRHQKLGDDWLKARIHWLSSEVARTNAGPIARRLLGKARTHYRQFCAGLGDRERYLAWSCLDTLAGQLFGATACPDVAWANTPEHPGGAR